MKFRIIGAVVIGVLASAAAIRAQTGLNVAGKWMLDPDKGTARHRPVFENQITITQSDNAISIDANDLSAPPDPARVQVFPLKGWQSTSAAPPARNSDGTPARVWLGVEQFTLSGGLSNGAITLVKTLKIQHIEPSQRVEDHLSSTITIRLSLDPDGSLVVDCNPQSINGSPMPPFRSVYKKG